MSKFPQCDQPRFQPFVVGSMGGPRQPPAAVDAKRPHDVDSYTPKPSHEIERLLTASMRFFRCDGSTHALLRGEVERRAEQSSWLIWGELKSSTAIRRRVLRCSGVLLAVMHSQFDGRWVALPAFHPVGKVAAQPPGKARIRAERPALGYPTQERVEIGGHQISCGPSAWEIKST